MSALTLQFRHGGVFLSNLGLWLDPHLAQTGPERVFVSHGHSDHTAAHREVILTAPTASFMRARLRRRGVDRILPFQETCVFAGEHTPYRLTLLPAGHILGSAMALVEAGGETLLYTGDFQLRPSLAAECCEPRRADFLVIETTFGRPGYRFPPADQVLRDIVAFCREALESRVTPVLLAYSLGKSQELLRGLADSGLPISLHSAVVKMTRLYEQCGMTFPPYRLFDEAATRDHVLICPPQSAKACAGLKREEIRTALITGWAVEPSCRFRCGVDAAFPLSDHADFPDLLDMVRRVAPKKVFTLHGFAADFARSVREMGFDAQALSQDEQLELPLR